VLQSELGIPAVEETGKSFVDNALLKARHAAAHARLPALADDSGLEVDALDGRPGIHSARFAGPGATDEQNNAALLAALANVPPERRTARYRCVLALVRNATDPCPLIAQGSWEGRIVLDPAGTGGFGYDPHFAPYGFECTAAQLSPALKNALSHRGAALRELIVRLDTCI
jgi:XTP/dITP diphosphohydrolase